MLHVFVISASASLTEFSSEETSATPTMTALAGMRLIYVSVETDSVTNKPGNAAKILTAKCYPSVRAKIACAQIISARMKSMECLSQILVLSPTTRPRILSTLIINPAIMMTKKGIARLLKTVVHIRCVNSYRMLHAFVTSETASSTDEDYSEVINATPSTTVLAEEILSNAFADPAFVTRNHGSARKLKTANLLLNVKGKNVNAQVTHVNLNVQQRLIVQIIVATTN